MRAQGRRRCALRAELTGPIAQVDRLGGQVLARRRRHSGDGYDISFTGAGGDRRRDGDPIPSAVEEVERSSVAGMASTGPRPPAAFAP